MCFQNLYSNRTINKNSGCALKTKLAGIKNWLRSRTSKVLIASVLLNIGLATVVVLENSKDETSGKASTFALTRFVVTPESSKSTSKISDLMRHFSENGVSDKFESKLSMLIGAVEGGRCGRYSDRCEVARFDDKAKARTLAESSWWKDANKKRHCEVRGFFILCTSNEEMLKIFKNF